MGLAACVDCKPCVQVCPTGIAIRKGPQYECIGCAVCIDVCDDVMQKMNYAPGLVRYDTQNGLAAHLTRGERLRRVFRPRVQVYSAVLLLISTALAVSIGLHLRDAVAVAVAPTEGRWISVTLRVPAATATQTAPGAHAVHFNIEREAQGDDAARTLREKSTFVLPCRSRLHCSRCRHRANRSMRHVQLVRGCDRRNQDCLLIPNLIMRRYIESIRAVAASSIRGKPA